MFSLNMGAVAPCIGTNLRTLLVRRPVTSVPSTRSSTWLKLTTTTTTTVLMFLTLEYHLRGEELRQLCITKMFFCGPFMVSTLQSYSFELCLNYHYTTLSIWFGFHTGARHVYTPATLLTITSYNVSYSIHSDLNLLMPP